MSRIAVLMPVFNAEKHLAQAIESILQQSFEDFTFYIINDGSSDSSETIIRSFNDSRIRYVRKEKNSGIVATLNTGLALISEEYIARMDADDIALPTRFEEQLKVMDDDRDIVMCGTQVISFGEKEILSSYPVANDDIKASLLFTSPFAHPTVMIRTSVLKVNGLAYTHDVIHAEDYNLWIELVKHGKLLNIDKPLLRYRVEGQNITMKNWSTRPARLKQVYAKLLPQLGIEPSEESLELHLACGGNVEKINSVKAVREYAGFLEKKNEQSGYCNPQSLSKIIAEKWAMLFYRVADNSVWETIKYWISGRTFKASQLMYLLKFHARKQFS